MSLEEKLAIARAHLDAAHQAQAAADRLSERARELSGGLLSFGGSGNQSAKRTLQGAQGRAFAAHRDAHERVTKWEYRIRSLERRIAERDRAVLTFEDVKGARFVRTDIGWHEVVRVNAKSVTVKTPWSWTDRIEFSKVREVRS